MADRLARLFLILLLFTPVSFGFAKTGSFSVELSQQNPVSGSVEINITAPEALDLTAILFDDSGNSTPVEQFTRNSAGSYTWTATIDTTKLANGTYTIIPTAKITGLTAGVSGDPIDIVVFNGAPSPPSGTAADTGGNTPTIKAAINQAPADGAADVPMPVILAWTGGDNTETYDIYFGIKNPPPLIKNQYAGNSYDAGNLVAGATYFWRIVSWNATDTVVGDVWKFTTANAAQTNTQEQATAPEPLNAQTEPAQTEQIASSDSEIDCGGDKDCFIERARECRLARNTVRGSIDLFGLVQTNVTDMKIKGADGKLCKFWIRNTEVSVKFSEGMKAFAKSKGVTDAEILEREKTATEEAKLLEGNEGVCLFKARDLADMLTRWKDGTRVKDDFANGECSGDFFNPGTVKIKGEADSIEAAVDEAKQKQAGVRKLPETPDAENNGKETHSTTTVSGVGGEKAKTGVADGQIEEAKRGVAEITGADKPIDTDGDGITDYDEINIFGTDPENDDTDGDGAKDIDELLMKSNPLDSAASTIIYEDPHDSGASVQKIFEVTKILVTKTERLPGGTEDASEIVFSGKGPPNSLVTVYIFSNPIVVTVRTDSDGNWTYKHDKELENGEHEIYITVTDSAGSIVKKSDPIPFVKRASAIELGAQTLQAAEKNTKPSFFKALYIYGIVILIVLVFGIALVIIGGKKPPSNIKGGDVIIWQ